mgnify:CR=1 FL=1
MFTRKININSKIYNYDVSFINNFDKTYLKQIEDVANGVLSEYGGLMSEENLIQKNFDPDKENILSLKDKNQILNLHYLFYWGVKFPSLIPSIKRLICLPPNRLYKFAYKISAMISSGRSFGANILEMFKLAWKLKKNRPE